MLSLHTEEVVYNEKYSNMPGNKRYRYKFLKFNIGESIKTFPSRESKDYMVGIRFQDRVVL